MKELDAYADSLGIEIIPCIQTLAHLRSFSRWGKANFEMDDTLMVDDPRTYELVERMIKTVSECFKTRRIHIGMDEAWELGRGNHLTKYGYEDGISMMKRHLERVNAIVEKYGCHAIIWSDMFIRPWTGGKYTALGDEGVKTVPQNAVEAVPAGVELVYWDYYSTNKDRYLNNLKTHAQFQQRLLAMVLTLFIIMTIGFMVIRLMPGGLYDDDVDMSAEQQAIREAKYHLDKPIPVQYLYFLKGVVTDWDWGVSLKVAINVPVWTVLRTKIPITLYINFFSLLLSLPLGIAFGIVAAVRKNSF